MSQPDLTQRDIETIIEIIKGAPDVVDFALKFGGTEIRMSRESHGLNGHAPAARAPVATPATATPASAAPAPAVPNGAPKNGALAANEFTVDAPKVGTFYRAPAPGEAPFVEAGQTIEGSTVLCIIEVMKLMNSISANRKGRVSRILVEDGEPVEFGQPLIVIEAID